MDHQKLTEYLEVLCQSGCDTVNAAIKAMENDQVSSITKDLTPEERAIVLRELKAIMSIYNH